MENTDKIGGPIRNTRELEFAVFCVESVAARLGVSGQQVYRAFTERSDILNGYIVPEYEMLHTQSKDYIVNDILELMRERDVTVGRQTPFSCKRNMLGSSPALQKRRGSPSTGRWTCFIAPSYTA